MNRNTAAAAVTFTTGPAIAREVNRRIKDMGRTERLVAGRGYCYFIEGESSAWYSSSVPVCRINHLTVDEWIAEFNSLVADHAKYR